MNTALRQPTGSTTPTRRRAAAATLGVGALLLVGTTLAGFSPPQNLLVLGLVLVVAWLVDGGTTRYLGAGLAATAIGVGLTLGGALELSGGATEHTLVYPLFGLAFLYMAYVNIANVRSGALTLLFVGASAANQNFGISFNLGWEFVAVLALWAAFAFTQAGRTDDARTEITVDQPVRTRDQVPVDAGVGER